MTQRERVETLRTTFNLLSTLLNDVQKYSTLTFSPKFAREINAVTTSLTQYINELEAEQKKLETVSDETQGSTGNETDGG